jgi:hydrogenase nickel incorporation protein HypA/HybF
VHELAISEAIVSQVCERVGPTRVARVVVEIGRLSAVVPDAVRFCFDLAAAGTVVENAQLEIVDVPGIGHCPQCGANREMDVLFMTDCVECGAIGLEIIHGNELRIREVEVM